MKPKNFVAAIIMLFTARTLHGGGVIRQCHLQHQQFMLSFNPLH
jgi:hypothetical protein